MIRLLESSWRFRLLLGNLILVIIGMPVIAELTGYDTTAAGLTVIVLSVLFASGRRGCGQVFLPVILVLGLVWLCTANPDSRFEGFHLLSVASLLVFSIGLTWSYLKEQRKVEQETLAAAAAVYLLFGLACGAVFAAFSVWRPEGLEFIGHTEELHFHDHVYYSFIVLTTIGFGEIIPRDALTRALTIFEGIAGMFYVAMVISRLVSLYHRDTDE